MERRKGNMLKKIAEKVCKLYRNMDMSIMCYTESLIYFPSLYNISEIR